MKGVFISLVALVFVAVGCKKGSDSRGENSLWTSSFELLEGEQTSNWSHLSDSRDLSHLSHYKGIYEALSDRQFRPHLAEKIPPVIHVIWLGPKHFPLESIENIREWKRHHPHCTFKFWTDQDRFPPCAGMEVNRVEDFSFQRLASRYEESDNWAEKSDILRFEILSQEGGIYIDHDADCLRSFDPLRRGYDFFAGLEAPHAPIDGLSLTLGIGLVAAAPGHPIIEKTIDLIDLRWNRVTADFPFTDEMSKAQRVMHRTYLPLTLATAGQLDSYLGDNIVFPAQYFYPLDSQEASFYSKHHYGTSWNPLGKSTPTKRYYQMLAPLFKEEARSFRIILWVSLLSVVVAMSSITIFLRKGKS